MCVNKKTSKVNKDSFSKIVQIYVRRDEPRDVSFCLQLKKQRSKCLS